MKKYFFVMSFLCLGLCNFVLQSYAQQVEVTHCSGKVEVLLEGADEYTDAQDNMVLSAGDIIKTASGAAVELSFNEVNTNLVRLDENTSVNISLSGDEKLEMTQGEVFSSISELPSGSAFEIRTPTAVSGARGTDWITKVTEEGTDVEALESVPYVKHFESSGNLSKQAVTIAAGQMTTVRKFQKPMMLRPIADSRRQKWQMVKKEVVQRAGEAIQKRKQMPPFNRKDFIHQIREKANLKRQDFKQMRNEMRDSYGVLVSGEKDKYLPKTEAQGHKLESDVKERVREQREQSDKFLRENVEEKTQRMGERNQRMEEKTRRMEKIGQDVSTGIKRFAGEEPNKARTGNREKTQPRRASPQKLFKPAGPGRR